MKFSFVSFLTPKRVSLKGLWLGSQKPENLYIFLHGLGGSIFSRSELMSSLATAKDAVLTFNNRGSGTINYFKKDNRQKDYLLAGVAHEVFTDCLDDIEGAINYAKSFKPKRVILVGHSTGCQKIIYYLSKKNQPLIKGSILLAPISDYADINMINLRKYQRALKNARALIGAGKPHSLLSESSWPRLIDAQRFISLYTPDSVEEVFNYSSGNKSKTLARVKVPVLALYAESDQYADRPAQDIVDWLLRHHSDKRKIVAYIISETDHSFSEKEKMMKKIIKNWLKKIK
ncbi:MAG: alpha/beta fold hydrolase [Patescibacteria group bacterium]|nr:alpha/beta fold hydrolase [Patescibacteria group bacterium]